MTYFEQSDMRNPYVDTYFFVRELKPRTNAGCCKVIKILKIIFLLFSCISFMLLESSFQRKVTILAKVAKVHRCM